MEGILEGDLLIKNPVDATNKENYKISIFLNSFIVIK